jgi:hypothetical protein
VWRDEDHINIPVTWHVVCTFSKPQRNWKYISNAEYFEDYSMAYFHSGSTITEIKDRKVNWTCNMFVGYMNFMQSFGCKASQA